MKWGLLTLLLCIGCASVDPTPDYDRAGELVHATTGYGALYRPGDEDLISSLVSEYCDDGLELDESVRICLLNNPNLQASLFQIGIAKADFVQSGLFSNPSIGVVFRFPSGGGLVDIEGGLAQNIANLWQLPIRKEASEHALNQTVLQISHQIGALAREAIEAHFQTISADKTAATAAESVEIAEELLDIAIERQNAGAGNALDVSVARAEHLDAQLVVRRAKLGAYEARRRLVTLLGLSVDPSLITILDDLPSPAETDLDETLLVDAALEHRLDVRAAEEASKRAADRLRYEQRSVFGDVSPSVEFERDDGDSSVGPGIALELPLFDQNQAQIAKAEVRYRQSQKVLEAVRLSVTQNVRGALKRLENDDALARFYREQLLPNRNESLQLAREAYRIGQSSFLSVLEAQRSLLDAKREYDSQRLQLAEAISRLEQAIARPLEAISAENSPD